MQNRTTDNDDLIHQNKEQLTDCHNKLNDTPKNTEIIYKTL